MLEPQEYIKAAAGLDAAIPTVDGSIGVDYSPPPIPEQEQARYICANCKGELVLRSHRCGYCESEIDWSSLDK